VVPRMIDFVHEKLSRTSREEHRAEGLEHPGGIAVRYGVEGSDLRPAQIQRRAGRSARERPGLTVRDREAGQVGRAPGILEQRPGLHLRVAGDEPAGKHLLDERGRRRLDDENYGHGEVPLGHRLDVGGDELAVQDALLVVCRQPEPGQHFVGGWLRGGGTRHAHEPGENREPQQPPGQTDMHDAVGRHMQMLARAGKPGWRPSCPMAGAKTTAQTRPRTLTGRSAELTYGRSHEQLFCRAGRSTIDCHVELEGPVGRVLSLGPGRHRAPWGAGYKHVPAPLEGYRPLGGGISRRFKSDPRNHERRGVSRHRLAPSCFYWSWSVRIRR